jgi:predicted nucleic-acid-binding protein
MKYLVDTNVIIRLITQDDPILTKKSLKIIRKIKTGKTKALITSLVIAEVIYVLTSPKLYNISREKSVLAIKIILETKNVIVEEKKIIYKALDLYNKTKLDFPDCYLIAKKEEKNFKSILSFDKKLI